MQFLPKKIDYTSPASAQGGPGIQKQITHYFGSPYLNMTAATFAGVSAAIGATIGDIWWLGGGAPANGGNAFMFVKAGAGLALGQLVSAATPSAGTVSAVTQGFNFVTQSFTTTAVNNEVDNWVWINSAAATLPQIRRIKANDAAATGTLTVSLRDPLRPNSPLDADIFDNIPVAAEATAIVRPYNVIVCTAALVPIGVALGTVTATNYTIIQVAGMAAVLVDGSGGGTNPVVVNVPLKPIAGGKAQGQTAASLYTGAGTIIPQVATAAALTVPIPCFVNFTGQ